MATNQERKIIRRSTMLLIVDVVIIIAAFMSVLFIYNRTDETLDKNVERRAYSEFESYSEDQLTLINNKIDDQFSPLRFLNTYYESGGDFDGTTFTNMAESLVEANDLCTIGFADRSGNAVSYDGEEIGNISKRDYFKKVISGESDRFTEYLPVTNLLSEPRVIFSVPVRRNGEIEGVMFISKEPEILSGVLLGTTEDSGMSVIISDSKGSIIVGNQNADNHIGGSNFFDGQEVDYSDGVNKTDILNNMKAGKSGSYSCRHGENEEYVSYSRTGINDWYLFIEADRAQLEVKYEKNMSGIKNLVSSIIVIFIIVLFVAVVLGAVLVIIRTRTAKDLNRKREHYLQVLYELGSAPLEYDPATDALFVGESFKQKFGVDLPDKLTDALDLIDKMHPESNIKRVLTAMDKALREMTTVAIEMPVLISDTSKWFRFILIPLSNLDEKTVVGAVMDVSDIHAGFAEAAEMLSLLPTGVHRTYLSDPIHVEYVSEGLCRMLGYSAEELNDYIKGDYSVAVAPHDKEKLREFAAKLASEPMVGTCEYEMIRKDGSTVFVSDTMESVRASSGIMYGYSTVFDITQKTEEITKLSDELDRLLHQEKIYREAVLTDASGFMEVNLTTGLITIWPYDNRDKNNPKPVMIEGLEAPAKYDDFEKWWAENMLISDREAFLKFSNCKYLLSQFEKGHTYAEILCRSYYFDDGEHDLRQAYFINRNEKTGEVYAICTLHDVTDQENAKRELDFLTEELKNSRINNSLSQMQPHFLYNTLASIREIVLEDPKYASDLIFDFTIHLRACIKAMSSKELIPFSKELENIKAYVNIEKMRFGDRLNVEYDIGCDDFMIVPLSIQPMVENSIRHGIYQRGMKGGTVRIATSKNDGFYTISVKDDGVGFDYERVKAEIESGKRDSVGIASLIFRLEKMMNATVDISSVKDTGTEITVSIPIKPFKVFLGEGKNEDDCCR